MYDTYLVDALRVSHSASQGDWNVLDGVIMRSMSHIWFRFPMYITIDPSTALLQAAALASVNRDV